MYEMRVEARGKVLELAFARASFTHLQHSKMAGPAVPSVATGGGGGAGIKRSFQVSSLDLLRRGAS